MKNQTRTVDYDQLKKIGDGEFMHYLTVSLKANDHYLFFDVTPESIGLEMVRINMTFIVLEVGIMNTFVAFASHRKLYYLHKN